MPLTKSFVGGFFVNDMPTTCLEDTADKQPLSVTQECRDYAHALLTGELQRLPIRELDQDVVR